MSGRYVGAATKTGSVLHAVWVTHNTVSPDVIPLPTRRTQEYLRATGVTREGLAVCGVICPTVVAGSQGGHDWDRIANRSKCLNCMRELSEHGN